MKIPLFLAPMAELSHRGLRELIEDFGGCDEYFSEMISASGLLLNGPFEKYYIDARPVPEKTVFQLVGDKSDALIKAAAILDKLDCKGIDINMGCSAPFIRKSGAGAAWMTDIDKAGKLMEGVRAVVKKRLSVKLRIGFKDDFDYLVRFCKRLESAGTELVTLHPRLITEKFKRRARREYVFALGKELNIPVAGNGDVASAEDIFKIKNEGMTGPIMVGRAAVRQPWIFAKARDFSFRVQEGSGSNQDGNAYSTEINIENIGLRFLELLAQYQPPEFHVSRAKRFFSFFCDNLKWGNFVKNQINREESLAGIEKVWRSSFFYKENF